MPGLAIPLAEPSVIKYGLQSLMDKHAALYVPFKVDPQLWRFLLGFARRCTMKSWRATMADYVPVSRLAVEAYDQLAAGGVTGKTHEAPIMAAFLTEEKAAGLVREIDLIHESGLDLATEVIDGDTLHKELPIGSPEVQTAIRINGQRYIDPGEFVASLAAAVQDRGGEIHWTSSGPIDVELVDYHK